jgi:hypothetical protein
VQKDYPVYVYRDSGNGTTSNARRNIVVVISSPVHPAEAEKIILLFLHGSVSQTPAPVCSTGSAEL